MHAFGEVAPEEGRSETSLPGTAVRHDGQVKTQRRNREFATWMMWLGATGDALAIIGGLLLAFALRFNTPLDTVGRATHASIRLVQYRGHFLLLSVTMFLALLHFGMYSEGRPPRLRKAYAIVVMSAFVWFLGNLGLSFELTARPIMSRIYLGCGSVCTLATLMLWRKAFEAFLHHHTVAKRLQRRIIFVGWSEQSLRLLGQIDADLKHPYHIVGYVPSPSGRTDRVSDEQVKRLGDYSELSALLAEHVVDLVIVADMNQTRGTLLDLVNCCEKEMVHLQVIPSCFQVLLSGLHLETTSGVPMLGVSRLPLDSPWNQLLKRGLDLVGGAVGLLLSGPLIAVFGALVYWESPGPIFYSQTRLGLDGKKFRIIKIRSMKLDAEAHGLVGWSRREDSRRLRIGALIRALNIDEVPQFWNVLKGEMSLVGPRPERPELIEQFKEQIPHYNARHGIKPGITGWAQVNGLRGDTDLVERIKYDLFYMENWNLRLEFQILLMTFFKRSNAY